MTELGIKFKRQMLDSVLFSLNHITFLEHVKTCCLPSCVKVGSWTAMTPGGAECAHHLGKSGPW